MARTLKMGLDFFPMDIDVFSDPKIVRLIKCQGGKAFTVYALLLCNIYKNGYYMRWDDELPFICSDSTGFERAFITEALKTCLSLGLFNKPLFESHNILTSVSIQLRYQRICRLSRRVCRIDDFSLLDNPEDPVITAAPDSTIASPTQITPAPALDNEINSLKADDVWLDNLQVLHKMSKDRLLDMLDEFRLSCAADGKEQGHDSTADAKRHFNSWLRIVLYSRNNANSKSNRQNQRRGSILCADEHKEYGGSF